MYLKKAARKVVRKPEKIKTERDCGGEKVVKREGIKMDVRKKKWLRGGMAGFLLYKIKLNLYKAGVIPRLS